MIYRWLARHYDAIFEFAPQWGALARREILEPVMPGVWSACDLACGTGSTAVALAARGIRMYGVDLSPGMCRAAREKSRRLGAKVRVIRADMRDFILPEPVDLVLCEFDALNHVPRRADLARVAKAVARALHPGGWFYFDVNNSPCFRHAWPRTWWIERPGVAAVIHGGYNRARDSAWCDVEWFLREGKLWRRRKERVEEVCWSPSEIRDALRAAGFRGIRARDGARLMPEDTSIRPGFRTFYLARKS